MKINIVSTNNGVGLTKDISILKSLLTEHEVIFSEISSPVEREFYDINIFSELVSHSWMSRAKINIMIPNPEWYELRWKHYLPRFNLVICKTRAAEKTFKSLSRKCIYTSFTSEDKLLDNIQKDYNKYLHVAGKSGQKQTEIVYKTWKNNPNLPHLTILQEPGKVGSKVDLPNVTIIKDHLSDQDVSILQNQYGVHICPSETEGFGHYIGEALSVGAVIITTNAEPMNELVGDYGVMCNYVNKQKQKFAWNYYINEQTLLESVYKTINIPNEEKANMSIKARNFYQENHKFFVDTFTNTMNGIYTNAKLSPNPRLEKSRISVSDFKIHHSGRKIR
jgi:glycosyltransferase involved in cell wall biosynthesis